MVASISGNDMVSLRSTTFTRCLLICLFQAETALSKSAGFGLSGRSGVSIWVAALYSSQAARSISLMTCSTYGAVSVSCRSRVIGHSCAVHILNVLCSGQHKHFDYLLQWMAYAVQHPE